MKDTHADFPPLTARQRFLLDEIKSLKKELKALPPWDPQAGTWVPEFYEIQKKIDDLSVKALRSGLLRGLPADSRRPGFRLVFDSHGEYAKILPRFGDFHPDLPPWAEKHFLDWIQMLRIRRHDGRDILRAISVVGLETGMKKPMDMTLIVRALELRGVEEEAPLDTAIIDEPLLDTLSEMLEKTKSRRIVTDEMLKIVKRHSKVKERKRTRTRKERRSWNWVIKKLVEEGLLTKKISHQAFRQMLKRRWPDYPWDKV